MKRLHKFILLLVAVCLLSSGYAQIDRTKAPIGGPAPKIQLGDYDIFTLKNGMKVLVVENHKIPKISYSLSLVIDPIVEGHKAGYVSIAGDLLEMGTANRSAQQIAEEVDFIGANLSTYSTGVNASGLSKYKEQILELMSDVALNPSFPQEEFDKLIKQNISGLQADKTSPKAIANNVKSRVLYGSGHPYGDVVTETSLQDISIDDCKTYYSTYFKPNVTIMAIVGDITTKEAKKMVEKYFGKWEMGQVPTHEYKMPEKIEGKRLVFANKDAAPQSLIQVINLIDLKKGAPDIIPATVMNAMLGRGFSGLLMKNLREDKAYTYGAGSRISSDKLVGTFYASSEVKANVTDSALMEIAFEMNHIRNGKLTQDHLDMTKATLAGDFARSLEDPSTIADFAMSIEKYKLPADYYATYLEKLDRVTLDDVKSMAQKYVDPNNAIYLVVGDGKLKERLAKLSTSKIVEEYDSEGNVVKEDPNAIPADLTPKMIIDSYIESIGGRSKVENLKDLSMKGEMKMGPMTMNVESLFKGNEKYCVKMEMNGQVMQSIAYNGISAKMVAMGQEKQASPEELTKFKMEAQMCAEVNFEALGYSAKIVGSEIIEGEKAYKLEIVDANGSVKYDFFGEQTGLKLKSIIQQNGMDVVMLYKDYRDVDGMKFPFLTITSVGPQEMPLVITELLVNKGIGDALFN